MRLNLLSRLAGRTFGAGRGSRHALETLEARAMLSDTPLPSLSALEDPTNAVIRFETSLGDVDIELFSTQAPLTVQNFMNNYVQTGKLDLSVFHRLTTDADDGIGVVQGGGFYFNNNTGVSNVEAVSPVVLEATGRSNVARTIAMARTSAPNSGTSQFFFNTDDNLQLDPTNPGSDGYAVFGRVIQGWDVILDIAALPATDISSVTPVSASPDAGNFQETPVTGAYNQAQGVREAALVYIVNAEIVKPSGSLGFFDQRLVFAEGHRTDVSSETINIHNPNVEAGQYQLIIRYEFGKREEVISHGSINANTSLSLPLSVAGQSSPNLVRRDTPYALILETSLPTTVTSPLPIAATSTRTDFNATASEAFFNTTGQSDATLQTWDFARIERNALSKEFLTWVNLSDTNATVTVTFYRQGFAPVSTVFSLPAYRRGGAEVFNLPQGVTLDDGIYSARVTSTQPIVASLSDWDAAADGVNPATAYTPGWTLTGVPGGTSTIGNLPNAEIKAGFTGVLSFINPNATAAVVTLSFWRTSRAVSDPPIQRILIVTNNSRSDYLLQSSVIGIPADERFTITYSSGTTPVGVQYTSVDDTGRNLASTTRRDGVSMSLATSTAAALVFANADIDPSRTDDTQEEIFSIFNPFANNAITFSYALEARFTDGTVVAVSSGSLTANARLDVRIDQNSDIRSKAQSDAQFRTFTLVLTGTGVNGSTTHNVAGFASLVRRDTQNADSVASFGALGGTQTSAGSTIFAP